MTVTPRKPTTGILGLAALAALWLMVIRQFGPQWSIFPEYNYGWGVPCLCAYLAWQRWQHRPPTEHPARPGMAVAVAACCALMLAAARWAHEANATWRITTWTMALCAVGISLAGVYLAAGRRWAWHFAFPIAFFLVAVPWPSQFQERIIQSLTRWNVAATVEALSLGGIPAMQHGNVIEVSTGMVGIDEACSGIRSLQATLMIALFFGELYRFTPRRRAVLLSLGVLLAFFFNAGRTFLLVTVAARQGIDAVGKWHDPAGVTILIGCFAGLWGIARWLRREPAPAATENETTSTPRFKPAYSLAVLALVVFAEFGTEAWYRAHETDRLSATTWSVRWPENQPHFSRVQMSERVIQALGFDEGSAVRWQTDDGVAWQAFLLRWHPAHNLAGRVKLQSVKSHRPEICLTASGLTQTADLGAKQFNAGETTLPFRRYVFEDPAGPIFVFYCFAEDGLRDPGQSEMLENVRSRLAAAAAGVRGVGERIFEVAIRGVKDQSAAEAVFEAMLPTMVQPASAEK